MKKTAVFALLLCVMLAAMLPAVFAVESNCPFRGNGYFAPYAVDDVIDAANSLAPKTADSASLVSEGVLLIASGAALLMLKKR